jgi:mono/diheme cytochrome c family protein
MRILTKNVVIIGLISVWLAACTTQLYTPGNGNVNKREDATLADLQQGKDIYSNKCGQCHKLPKPESHTQEQWTKIIEKMAPKAKLDKSQTELVHKYLVNY